MSGTNDCYASMNDFAQAFHSALDALLLNISSQLPGMKYSLGNTYSMTLDVIKNPKNYSKNSSTLHYNLIVEFPRHIHN